jgi:prevent-host-death family protein
MKTATIREAQHHLSKLLREVAAGEEVVLTRRGKKVAKLTCFEEEDPAEKEVDWTDWVAKQREFLKTMPPLEGSPVLEERESYRW